MPTVPTLTPAGAEIRKLRIQRGLSQAALARKIRRHPQTIRCIEDGRQSRASELLISQIAKALRADVEKITIAADAA